MIPILPQFDRPLLFGHRGYSIDAPENTMGAFSLCKERSIPGIELDVHVALSGEVVVVHDHNLSRLASVDALVEDLPWEVLKELDVGSHKKKSYSHERIPLLSEVFETFKDDFYFDIELKAQGIRQSSLAQKTWDLITSFNITHRCIVSSFNPFTLRAMQKASQRKIPCAIIYCESDDVPTFLHHGFGRYIARTSVLKPDKAQVASTVARENNRRHPQPIIAWTVDDIHQGSHFLELGIDGIISNDPQQFLTNRAIV